MLNEPFLSSCVTEDYSSTEKSSFWLHICLALASVPLNFVSGYAGLIISPYLIWLTLRARSQYLLPIIIILAYSSPLRLFFCSACFFYVLFNMPKLRRFHLLGVWWLYLCLSPFFIWYFYMKMHLLQSLVGVGDLASGFGTYFMFSCAFWAILVVRKMGVTFFKGLFCWSLFLIFLVSFVGTDSVKVIFCRQVFLAIPVCAATFCYCIVDRGRRLGWFRLLSGLGCLALVLDFVGLLRYKLSFTSVGLMLLSSFFVFLSKRMKRVWINLNPLVFFILSAVVVFHSANLVEKYRGINKGYGSYDEMKVNDWNSLMVKLQRKIVDDRASVWNFNLIAIKDQMRRNPIWIDIKPYIEADIYIEGKGYSHEYMTMDAHNTLLHLLRHFGVYGGLGLYLLFMWYFCRRENRKIMIENQHSLCLIVVMSVCVAQGVIGGHTGHYPVTLAFGPVLYALLGSCWRMGYEMRGRG